jgi:DNA invertase Pin-like site-specific DNA recombinase
MGDKQQVTVNRQKRLALDDCKKLGLIVHSQYVFIDNGTSAWQRDRKRPGWDELIAACKRGEIKHIVCYHPDRLMRQPRDLEELLSISDQYGIILYGRVNARDLQDPDDRYALRIEIAHACRTSDDASRRLRDKFQEKVEAGYYHGSRPYGYTKNGMKLAPAEAEVVREIFRRFIDGEGKGKIAADLNAREISTAKGVGWTETSIRVILHSRHVAGINAYHGEGNRRWEMARHHKPGTVGFHAGTTRFPQRRSARRAGKESFPLLYPSWAGDVREMRNCHVGVWRSALPLHAGHSPERHEVLPFDTG